MSRHTGGIITQNLKKLIQYVSRLMLQLWFVLFFFKIVLSRCPDYIVRDDKPASVQKNFTVPLEAASTGVQITIDQAIGVVNR